MNDFKLVYDFLNDPNTFSWADKMLIPMAGILLISYLFKKKIKKFRVWVIILTIFSSGVSIFATTLEYTGYADTIKAIEKGETLVVEGKVTNFKHLDDKNHSSGESFKVNGVKFIYSDYHRIHGYHHTCSLGGVICKDGQVIRLSYIKDNLFNRIIKLELAE